MMIWWDSSIAYPRFGLLKQWTCYSFVFSSVLSPPVLWLTSIQLVVRSKVSLVLRNQQEILDGGNLLTFKMYLKHGSSMMAHALAIRYLRFSVLFLYSAQRLVGKDCFRRHSSLQNLSLFDMLTIVSLSHPKHMLPLCLFVHWYHLFSMDRRLSWKMSATTISWDYVSLSMLGKFTSFLSLIFGKSDTRNLLDQILISFLALGPGFVPSVDTLGQLSYEKVKSTVSKIFTFSQVIPHILFDHCKKDFCVCAVFIVIAAPQVITAGSVAVGFHLAGRAVWLVKRSAMPVKVDAEVTNILEDFEHAQRLSLLHHVTHPFSRGVLVGRLKAMIQEETDRLLAREVSTVCDNVTPLPPPLPPPPLPSAGAFADPRCKTKLAATLIDCTSSDRTKKFKTAYQMSTARNYSK